MFLRSVCRVITLELIGGEPFSYPELGKVLKYVVDQGKVNEIEITTNGTIVPKPPIVEQLHNPKITVRISRYNCVHTYKELIETLLTAGVRIEVLNEMQWIDAGDFSPRHRKEYALRQIYFNCDVSLQCKTLYRGRVYTCP